MITEKQFCKIFNIPGKQKTPVKVIFKDGREIVLSLYESISWIKEDQDVFMIIDNLTGEIIYIAGEN